MHEADVFIHDMAIIMLVAASVATIFQRLRQPVVLGYLLVGIILGPYILPFEIIHSHETISILAHLGVVFLMFSLGLEFSLKKIAKIGVVAFSTALCETSIMITIGYNLGCWLGWSKMDSIFLGAMLAISSTTIIVKALGELNLKQHKFAQLIFGVLIVEDILAIAIIAFLSGIATTGSIDSHTIFSITGQLSLFIIVSLIIGLLTIPRFLNYLAKFKSNETMLIAVLGLCFGFGLIVLALNYSIALGSFMIGAIIAEAKPLHLIEKLVEPLRDMFCAIFFVTIGMMFNPTIIIHNLGTILIISSVLILGKITGNTIGAFCSGEKVSTSLKIGMGLAQIGEFSFIIASLGSNLKVTSDSLYPIAIAVSAITTLTTPYLIKLADPLAFFIHQRTPKKIVYQAQKYTIWLSELHPKGDSAFITKTIAKIFLQIIVNCALIMAVFLAGTYLANRVNSEIINLGLVEHEQLHKSIICGIALLISLPFAIASYRKFKALAMILAEIIIRHKQFGNITYSVRQVIFELLPIIAIFLIMSFIFSLTSPILPQTQYLFTLIMFTILIGYWFRKQFIFMQSWLQIRLFAVLSDNDN